MKKILLTTFILILLFVYIVPPYNELNNLAIIDSIGVIENESNCTIYLREIIPSKDNNGISYKYKIHKEQGENIKNCWKKISKDKKKKLYLNKVKFLITNYESDNIKNTLKINFKTIFHTNDVLKKLKSIR